MPDRHRQGTTSRLGDRLLSPSSRFQRYRWSAFALASILEIIFVLLALASGSMMVQPLDPVGSGIVIVSVITAGLSGTLAGVGASLVGVAASFLLLAHFDNDAATANAITSAILWFSTALATGLTVGHLRRQVERRETALRDALATSLETRERLERVLDFAPTFYSGGGVAAVAEAICRSASETFGATTARIYSAAESKITLLAVYPSFKLFPPGLSFSPNDFPDLDEALTSRRPLFQQDMRRLRLKGQGLRFQVEMAIVSAVRIPLRGPEEVMGLLSLGWDEVIDTPTEDMLATMQRFGDQAAIAWQTAQLYEARENVMKLRDTLDRVLALAPTFHASTSREKVAEAICQAAMDTFDCSGAAVFRAQGGQLRLLARASGMEIAAEDLRPYERQLTEESSPSPGFINSLSRPTLCVPLRINERGVQDVFVLAWDEVRERPDENYLVVVQRFADQAALALTNASAARLHARLEASLLPATRTLHPHFNIVNRYRTGEQRLSLGGDFVGSVVMDDGSVCFVIGDVTGHGPDAAALGATLRSTWRALAMIDLDLPQTMSVMETILIGERRGANAFATAIIGKIDSQGRTLTMTSAGHPPPILVTSKGVSALDTPPSPPLGFSDSLGRQSHTVELPESWNLLCYTDGLTDARVRPKSGERMGEARLMKWLECWQVPLPDEAELDRLIGDVEKNSGEAFADDVAVLLISTKPRSDDN